MSQGRLVVSASGTASPWPRERFEGVEQVERHHYLIPLDGPLSGLEIGSDDGLPTGWGCTEYGLSQGKSPDGSPWPTLILIPRGQLGEFLDFEMEPIIEHLVPPEDQDRVRGATHYLMILGQWETRADFAHLQTCLAACRSALRAGGIGVVDVFAKRWLSRDGLARLSLTRFVVEEHIMVQLGQGFCVTAGLTEKFGRCDVLMRVPDSSYNDSATFLLNEIAHNLSGGKKYDESSLFRWRQNGHMCQLMFKTIPLEDCTILPSNSVLEAVDVIAQKDGEGELYLGAGDHADLALQEFERAAPHGNRAYGWPPGDLPAGLESDSLCVLGIVPGTHSLKEVLEILGQPHREVGQLLKRWAFQDPRWEAPVFVQVKLEPGSSRVVKVSANSFSLNGNTVTDRHQFSEVLAFLGEPDLSRQVLLAPDGNLLRTEYLKFFPASAGGAWALQLEIDDYGKFCCAILTFSEHSPQELLQELGPAYEHTLEEGFRLEEQARSGLVERLELYLQVCEQLYRSILPQCPIHHPVWHSEQALLKTQVSGTLALLGADLSPQEWESLPEDFQRMRPEFHSILNSMNVPQIRAQHEPVSQKLEIDYFSYACMLHAAVAISDGLEVPPMELNNYLVMTASAIEQVKEQVRAEADEMFTPLQMSQVWCAGCGSVIVTDPGQRMEVNYRHEWDLTDLEGHRVRVRLFSKVTGVRHRDSSTGEDSWFRGFARTEVECEHCGHHLGWHFQGDDLAFFGLV